MKKTLPEAGFVRLHQIIGQKEVSPEEAESNKMAADKIRSKFPKSEQKNNKKLDLLLAKVGSRTPTSPIAPIIPVSKSTWWAGVKSKRFPQPVKLSARTTAWRVSDILALIEQKSAA